MDLSVATILNGGEEYNPAGYTFRREAGFPYFTLSLLISGRFQIATSAGTVEIPPRSLVLVPPGVPYSVIVTQPEHELWFHFNPRPEWQPLLDWGERTRIRGFGFVMPVADRRQRRKIVHTLQEAVAYRRAHFRTGPRLAELALEHVLLLAAEMSDPAGAMDERLLWVMEALPRDLARPWRAAEMAALANLSDSRFAHLFRDKIGVAPLQYLERLRIDRAKALLLSTNKPVKQIAAEVGYPDPLHFSGRFRRLASLSPRDFRRLGRSPGTPLPRPASS